MRVTAEPPPRRYVIEPDTGNGGEIVATAFRHAALPSGTPMEPYLAVSLSGNSGPCALALMSPADARACAAVLLGTADDADAGAVS